MDTHNSVIPMVVDGHGNEGRAYDIYSLLLKERIVFLNGQVEDRMANLIVAQLLFLDSQDSKRPINLYICSPGGSVYAGLGIYDTMQMIKAPVYTTAVGMTASMATVLLSAGAAGKRYALPHATIHMHPAGGGAKGYTEDVRIAYQEQERTQAQLFHLVGKHTGHTWREIEADFLRDRYMNAIQAVNYGLVDEILGDASDLIFLDAEPVKLKRMGEMPQLQ